MTNHQLIRLDVDSLTDEEARVIGIELLKEDIDEEKAAVKRNGLISAVLAGGMVLAGMNTIPGYAIMGVDSMFLFNFFNRLQAFLKKKKMLKKFEGNYYEDDYRHFLKECQKYVSDNEKFIKSIEGHSKNRWYYASRKIYKH